MLRMSFSCPKDDTISFAVTYQCGIICQCSRVCICKWNHSLCRNIVLHSDRGHWRIHHHLIVTEERTKEIKRDVLEYIRYRFGGTGWWPCAPWSSIPGDKGTRPPPHLWPKMAICVLFIHFLTMYPSLHHHRTHLSLTPMLCANFVRHKIFCVPL